MTDIDHFAICPDCGLGGNHHAELLPATAPLRQERDAGSGETVTICSWGGRPPRIKRRCVFCRHEWHTRPKES